MCPLIDKVGCISRIRTSDSEEGPKFETGRTFAGNCKQDDTTWFLNVGYCKVPYELHFMFLLTPDK